VLVSPLAWLILVEKTGCELHLPRLSIPRWTRAAEQVQTAIEAMWGFKVIVTDFLRDRPGRDSIVLVELRRGDGTCAKSRAHLWAHLGDISESEIAGPERSIIQRLLVHGTTGRGVFSRIGWIDEALSWIGSQTGVDRSHFTADIKQLNAQADSALVRFDRKDAPAYWFKAAGDPDSREFRVTAALAQLFPAYLPRLVASHETWKAWLMEDAGHPLDDTALPPLLRAVVLRLAELQKASARHITALLASGCGDQRIAVLRIRIPETMECLKNAMAQQNFSNTRRIGDARLQEIGSILETACLTLETIGIPDTLIHNDLSFENILVGRNTCVFTDWATASIGNPFVTFEHLRVQIAQEKKTEAWVPQLTEIYQESWRAWLPSSQIKRAFSFVPLIAVASHFYSRREWLTSDRRHEPQFQSYARVLARQMDRAARVLELVQD
jgi:hypothetical protein